MVYIGGDTTTRCYDLYIGRVHQWDSNFPGFAPVAVQIRFTFGGYVEAISAKSSGGVLAVHDSEDIHFGEVASYDDRSDTVSAVYIASDTTDKRLIFDNIYIDMTSPFLAIRAGGVDCTYNNVLVRGNWSGGSGLSDASTTNISVRGSRNTLRNVNVIDKGLGRLAVAIDDAADNKHVIDGFRGTGIFRGISVIASASADIALNPLGITFAAGITNSGAAATGLMAFVGTPTLVTARRPVRVKTYTLGSAVTWREDMFDYSYFRFDQGSANTITIQNPNAATMGMETTFEFVNTFGAAVGAITFGTDWIGKNGATATIAPPSIGLRKVIHFKHDGVKWQEQVHLPLDSANLVGANVGDASALTLTFGIDAPTQRWATNLTANRTAKFLNTNAQNGAAFRVVRTGLGAFNLDVQRADATSLKTIVGALAAYVDIAFDGTNWILTGYGTL
jgi:hypothetical protein